MGRSPDDYLFPSEKGPKHRMNDNRVQIALYGALRRLGLNKRDPSGRGWIYSPHLLRLGFETALINAGYSAIIVSMLMDHDLGTEPSYYKPSVRELAETWRKHENALRLDVEETTPPAKITELEAKVKVMSEQIEALREVVEIYEQLISRLKPKEIQKTIIHSDYNGSYFNMLGKLLPIQVYHVNQG